MTPRKAAGAGLKAAVASGDHRGALEALRDRLAAEIERSEGAAVASLSKQLADVLGKLAAMPNGEASRVDELAKRRAARRKAAATPKSAAKPVKRRAGGGRARS